MNNAIQFFNVSTFSNMEEKQWQKKRKKHVVQIISTYREHQARVNTRANEFLSRHTDDANQRRQKVVTRERPVSRQAVTERKVKISERQFDGRA